MNWSPISEVELKDLILEQLTPLNKAESEFYEAIKVPFRKVFIERSGALEKVFIVAELPDGVVFYEDVEEGFEFTVLNTLGVISDYSASQLELSHVIRQLMSKHAL
jgi:hypothetical protein